MSSAELEAAIKYRLIARPSVDLHVLSSLWIAKVGIAYDSALPSSAMGTRVRPALSERKRTAPPVARSSFKSWLEEYRQWSEGANRAIVSASERGRHVAVLTSDAQSYYYRIGIQFIRDPAFLRMARISVTPKQDALTLILVEALRAWASRTPLHKDNPSVGVPVGLAAARVIANVALVEFDRHIVASLKPLYYARYVDDIILALDITNRRDIVDLESLVTYIAGSSQHLRIAKDGPRRTSLLFEPSYHRRAGSKIVFAGDKHRCFILSPSSGTHLVRSLLAESRRRTSEWRMLPDEDFDVERTLKRIVAPEDEETGVETLRKAGPRTVRRNDLSLVLRKLERLADYVRPEAWRKERAAFARVLNESVLTLPQLFDFSSTVVERSTVVLCRARDFAALSAAIDKLESTREILSRIKSPALRIKLASWFDNLGQQLYESLVSCFDGTWSPNERDRLNSALKRILKWCSSTTSVAKRSFDTAKLAAELRGRDLGPEAPWRAATREGAMNLGPGTSIAPLDVPALVVDRIGGSEFQTLAGIATIPPAWFLFPTRPLAASSLPFVFNKHVLVLDPALCRSLLNKHAGFAPDRHPVIQTPSGSADGYPPIYDFPSTTQMENVVLAIPSVLTQIGSWTAAAKQTADPDTFRFQRLSKLVNEMLIFAGRNGLQYMLFPELSVPRSWFFAFADALASVGVSLIAGVEYEPSGPKYVTNQVWAALVFGAIPGFWYPYIQEKASPAPDEKKGLRKKSVGKKLRPRHPPVKPVLLHGSFSFSVLICSEATDIRNRSKLRGMVDALLVHEWNQDLTYFESVVASAANDLHAFVVQVNNRVYGDSWVRAPAKNSWERDLLRLRGGDTDVVGVTTLRIAELRRFQTRHRRKGDFKFKPLPDGFRVARFRK